MSKPDKTQDPTEPIPQMPMPDYLSYDTKIRNAIKKKGFEITATYSSSDGETIQHGTIGPGKVLLGKKVHSTRSLFFSGNNLTIYLCAKKSKKSGKKYKWSTWVQLDDGTISGDNNETIKLSFSFPLVRIEEGRIVEDNRYLICLSTVSRSLPGETIYDGGEGSDETPAGDADCDCPTIYNRLITMDNILKGMDSECDVYLSQWDDTAG